MPNSELRKLPAIDTLLKHDALADLIAASGHKLVVEAARNELAARREEIVSRGEAAPSEAEIIQGVVRRAQAMLTPTLQPVSTPPG
ncbi:MAG: hypothetical protein ACE5G8_11295 [Anaerolineae bacterium]